MTAQIQKKIMQRHMRTVCYLYTMAYALDVWPMTLRTSLFPWGIPSALPWSPTQISEKLQQNQTQASRRPRTQLLSLVYNTVNLLGAYSLAELTECHIRRIPSNSIKLFTSNTVGRMRLDNTTKVWGWIKGYHKDCKYLIQGGPWESEHALLKRNAVKEWGKPHRD